MPRRKSVPRPYEKAGQLVVILRDPRTGYRRTVYLGGAGTALARREYARVITEWEDGDRVVAPPSTRVRRRLQRPETVTVAEVVLGYWKSEKTRHTGPDDTYTAHGRLIREALRTLRQHAGGVPAREFGPLALQQCRGLLVESGRYNRANINRVVRLMVGAFKWAVAQELIPAATYDALACVEPIKRGQNRELRESDKVRPVSDAAIAAVRPHVPRQVWALIELQRLTGARAGELVNLRAVDLDTTGDVWLYRPEHHKTEHRGHERIIAFGPEAQAVVRPFLIDRPVDASLFSPAEAEGERRERLHHERTTPLSCGNRPGSNRQEAPKRQAGNAYTTDSYRRCIERACDAAHPPPADVRADGSDAVKAWRQDHRWTPHRLRHTAATNLRRSLGLETASLVLGHSSATITDAVYAERDLSRVLDAARRSG